jgi:sugar-phosphatase
MPDTTLNCDAVLFDMDGTLVDSTEVVERQWAQWASRHRIDLATILAVCHGRPTIDTLRMVAPHLASAEEAAGIDAAEALDIDGLRPVRGAPELIASLPRGRWAIVTSADRKLAVSRLRAVGLEIPGVLVTVEDIARGKPDPAAYLGAAQRLGADPRRAVVLEDTPVGIQAGRAAGATVIGVTTTYRTLDDCHLCVADLSAIRAAENNGTILLRITAS